MHLASGGGAPSGWIRVPQVIRSYNDVQDVISQISPLKQTYARARSFGLGAREIQAMRLGLFAYLLGIMVGDSGKLGGEQRRYASMNLDLQLTKKRSTNERLGAFVLVCANDLGLEMARFKDKQPTGQTAISKQPSAAYRWTSERSPLLAWMFSTGLGLQWNQTTTTHQVHMDWIFNTSRDFRIRFVQGVADSDGCVKDYVVEIASVPNSAFLARLLQSLGVTSAHVAYEGGEPLKTRMNRKQASALPVFNEFVNSYRYQKMASLNGS